MDEESGQNVADSSSNHYDGTATGTTIVDGQIGKARSFNGSSDLIDTVDMNELDGATAFTIAAWVKTTTRTDYDGVIAKYSSDTSRIGMSVGGLSVGDNDDVGL